MSLPHDFRCPITHAALVDPATAADGETYERTAIEQWFALGKRTSPLHGSVLSHTNLVTNRALARRLEAWAAEPPSPPSPPSTSPLPVSATVSQVGASYEVTPVDADVDRPTRVVFVTDTSGSMGVTTLVEGEAFQQIDFVRHAINVVVSMLGDGDEASLVEFNGNARVARGWTRTNAAGGAMLRQTVDAMRVGGMTNLWGGLAAALALVASKPTDGASTHVVVLTDGASNVGGRRAEDALLADWLDAHPMDRHLTLHFFGVGYELEASKLYALSQVGNGAFGYIPDFTMVGTVFVNVGAWILSTMAQRTALGDLRYGQTLSVDDVGGLEFARTPSSPPTPDADTRARFVAVLTGLGPTDASSAQRAAFAAHLDTLPASVAAPYRADLEGEIARAVADPAAWGRWGRYWTLSLLRAHELQFQINFKDRSTEQYERGTRWQRLVRLGGERVLSLALPQGCLAQRQATPGAALARSTTASSTFYNRSGGCFHGDGQVLLATGERRPIKQLTKGTALASGATVRCLVVSTPTPGAQPFYRVGRTLLTGYHPYLRNDQWAFPSTHGTRVDVEDPTLYNLVLEGPVHRVDVDGLVAVTLGHGCTDSPVVAHPFFGTQAVVSDLAARRGWDAGRVHVDAPARRCPTTRCVVGL